MKKQLHFGGNPDHRSGSRIRITTLARRALVEVCSASSFWWNAVDTYLVVWVHALDARLALHALPRIALDDRNHFRRQFQARRMSWTSCRHIIQVTQACNTTEENSSIFSLVQMWRPEAEMSTQGRFKPRNITVPVNGQWRNVPGKVTVGLASHWTCITDFTDLTTYRLEA